MPIIVKHSGSPGLTATAAFGAGQGARIQQLEDERLKMLQRQNEMQTQQSFAAKQAELGREFSAEQAGLGREFSAEQAGLGREFQSDQAETAARRAQEIQQQNIEFGYSAKQRAEFNEATEAYDEAVKSGQFTEDELIDVKRQIVAKQAGIKPLPRIKKPEPTLQGHKVGETWSEGGWLNTVESDRYGTLKVKKLGEDRSLPTIKDVAGLYQTAVTSLTGPEGEPPDPVKVEAWVKGAIELHQKMVRTALAKPGAEMGPPVPESSGAAALTAQQDFGQGVNLTPNNARLLSGAGVSPDVIAKTATSKPPPSLSQLDGVKPETLKVKVAEAAKRNGVSEDVVWAMLQKEMNGGK